MKLGIALQILLLSQIDLKLVKSQASETIKEAVGSGCSNAIDFSSSFIDEGGNTCDACQFCDGSSLSSLFNPKVDSTCIACGSNDACKTFQVLTSFQTAWVMEFTSLASSSMSAEFDPQSIKIKGSTDTKAWDTLFDSDDDGGLEFPNRKQYKEFILNANNKELKYYMIEYKLKEKASRMYVGSYGLVQSYTKLCTSALYAAITGQYIMSYDTLSPTGVPTENPTTLAPTTAAPTGKSLDNNSIKTAVRDWTTNEATKAKVIAEYGNISDWQTSKVTNMGSLFAHQRQFNDNISKWNVAAVTTMTHMFFQSNQFNGNIANWNVAAVTDMNRMFCYASTFNGDLSKWNTAAVTDMSLMFFNAIKFNNNVSTWNVAANKSMQNMFQSATSFNLDIPNWNTAAVTDMQNAFNNAKVFNGVIKNWNVANVTNMYSMFNSAKAFNSDISNWNVVKVKTMRSMFFSAESFNADVSNWNTAAVENFYHMFVHAKEFNVDLDKWNLASATTIHMMFYGASSFNQKLCWVVPKDTNVQSLFQSTAGGSIGC